VRLVKSDPWLVARLPKAAKIAQINPRQQLRGQAGLKPASWRRTILSAVILADCLALQ